jgi:hypothetical protein
MGMFAKKTAPERELAAALAEGEKLDREIAAANQRRGPRRG